MIDPFLLVFGGGVIQRHVSCNLHDHRLDGDAFCQDETVQTVHSLRENGVLINGIARDRRPQNSLESLQDPQSLCRRR